MPVERARKTIVVVDDSREYLDLVQDVLEEERYRVVTCDDASQALRTIREVGPDLLVLDVRMPNAPDWQILDLVRRDPETTATPTLVCTAAQPEVRERAGRLREQGCEVLLKPFMLDDLLAKVRLLAGSSAGSAIPGPE